MLVYEYLGHYGYGYGYGTAKYVLVTFGFMGTATVRHGYGDEYVFGYVLFIYLKTRKRTSQPRCYTQPPKQTSITFFMSLLVGKID